jgi:hypothetical protein
MEPITNRVAASELEVFNLEELWDGRSVVEFDLAPYLLEGLVLREKPFREAIKETDWEVYRDKHVALYCSTDAIVPTWAWMLVALRLEGIAAGVSTGRAEEVIRDGFVRAAERFDWEIYRDRMVVVKGCGSAMVPLNAYVIAVQRLRRVARKLMYGEPCSAVPLWRRPRAADDPGRTEPNPAAVASIDNPD